MAPRPPFLGLPPFPSNPRQTVHFLDTFPASFCLGVVRMPGVRCPTKPAGGVGFLYLVAAESACE